MLNVTLTRIGLTCALALSGFPAMSAEGQFLGAVETSYPEWFKESFLELSEDIREAADSGKRVMLFFHQDGCPYCNLLVERNLSQKDIEDKMRTHFDVIALNLWGDREVTIGDKSFTEKTFAAAAKVQFTPTLMFFDEGGKVALRLNGYHPPQDFSLALDYVAGHKEKESKYRDFYAANKPPPARGELKHEPFFQQPPYDLSTRSAEQPLAVFFEQTKCPNCDTLHDDALADANTRALAKQLHCVQLDMWSDTPVITPAGEKTTARDWAQSLGITYAPTVVFFSPSGREVIRSDSWFRIFHTQSMMDYVVTGAYDQEPHFQRYISARADALRAQGIDVDIWR